jgi:hypothetical protein
MDALSIAGHPEVQKEFTEAAGDLSALIKGTNAVISFVKLRDSFDQIPAGDAEYRDLMRQTVDLTRQRKLAELHRTQADLTLRAAEQKLALATQDLTLANQQLTGLVTDMVFLEGTARTLIRSAQRYMDVLIKYAFLAARALEIYTFADMSNAIRYDYGYIHPDREEELPLPQLIGEYVASWSRLVGIVTYRDRFEQYFLGPSLVHDIHYIAVEDAQRLADFRARRDLYFTVALSDLPPSRFEAKLRPFT